MIGQHVRHPLSQEELKQKQLQIANLVPGFELMSDHIVITDENANIIYANPAVERHSGYKQVEVLGRNPGDLWGGHMSKREYVEMWGTIKSRKQPWHGEIENVHKNGTHYWQELRITPVLDDRGAVAFFIGIEPDVTARKVKDMIGERIKQVMIERAVRLEELDRKLKAIQGSVPPAVP